jgi:hypothetical protein
MNRSQQAAAVTAFVTVSLPFDGEPTVNSQDELRRAVTSGEKCSLKSEVLRKVASDQ